MAKRIISSLSHIELESPDPLKLLLQWKNEAAACTSTANIMCIATSTKDGHVSNRNVMLQDITDGLVFVAKKNGKKIQDILDNPAVAATFLYIYTEAEQRAVARQIRIEGTVVELDRSICENYFRNQPISGQIRDVICNQGQEVDWNELKRKHDELLQKLEREEILQLEMPEDQAAWKITPERFDFYHSLNAGIADRVVFTKDGAGKWKYIHVAA